MKNGGAVWGQSIGWIFWEFWGMAALAMWMGSLPLYWIHLFLTLRFSKNLSLGFGVAEMLISALLLTGLGTGILVFFPWFMGISFQYGSPAKIYGSKWVGDMGESPMDQNLSLDCGGALCHTFFMVSSVSRESV